jgi:hypothetical protein
MVLTVDHQPLAAEPIEHHGEIDQAKRHGDVEMEITGRTNSMRWALVAAAGARSRRHDADASADEIEALYRRPWTTAAPGHEIYPYHEIGSTGRAGMISAETMVADRRMTITAERTGRS